MFYDHMAKRVNPDLLSDRAKRNKVLRPVIEHVWPQNYKVYGVRKVWHQLRQLFRAAVDHNGRMRQQRRTIGPRLLRLAQHRGTHRRVQKA